jgi:hypothetical protein
MSWPFRAKKRYPKYRLLSERWQRHPRVCRKSIPGRSLHVVSLGEIPTRPCNPLKISNKTSLGKKGFAAVVTVIQAVPNMKTFRLPYRSAILPHRSRKQPKVSMYEDTIHCIRLAGIFKSSAIVGSIITADCTANVCRECQDKRFRKRKRFGADLHSGMLLP